MSNTINSLVFWKTVKREYAVGCSEYLCNGSGVFKAEWNKNGEEITKNARIFLKEEPQEKVEMAYYEGRHGACGNLLFHCENGDIRRPVRLAYINWNLKRLQ